jgi:hypothetical protein
MISRSLEDVQPDPTQGWQPILRDILTAVPVFDGYNMPPSQFIKECREVQNALLPHEKANVLILLRKLRGQARRATIISSY